MVERIKINEYGDCIYSEDEIIEQLYSNPQLDITNLFIQTANQYNESLKKIGIDLPFLKEEPNHSETATEFDQRLQKIWFMPDEYNNINTLQYLLDRCQTQEEKDRVVSEHEIFEKKGFIKVLQFLIYFIDTLRKNNIVWGVGRGSSVASFCLFLIGVHKINPLQHNLDHREFLR
jgi:DNA polymerase III alpha subunit